VAALALLVIQFGAVLLVTGQGDFALGGDSGRGPVTTALDFTNVGTEYNFAILVMCITVMLLGSGVVSVDYLLARRRKAAARPSPELQPVG
jgi:uncharacterized membrane protein YphA (DoxX/SURF4 family)